MSIAERRTDIATAITENLRGIKISPYKGSSPSPLTGWLQISKTDLEAVTYGEVRLSVECLILVAADRTDFEKAQDKITVPLIAAVTAAGGRGTVVQPYTETVGNSTFYAISAQFVTEAFTDEEEA